jgi:ornithine carbamoyltransferase
MKDFLRLSELDAGGLRHVLRLAASVKRQPRRWRHLLADQIVVIQQPMPSTVTRLAFEAAVRRLGGVASLVGDGDPLLDGGGAATIEDAARAFGRYSKVLVASATAHADVERLAAASPVPVVNGGTDLHRPCHALADLFTLQEHFGRLGGLRVAYLGEANGVANSLIEACALAGVDLVEVRAGAEAVFTDAWLVPPESGAVVVDVPPAGSLRSLVWEQAENQLHIAQAVLMTLLPDGHPYEPARCRPAAAATPTTAKAVVR